MAENKTVPNPAFTVEKYLKTKVDSTKLADFNRVLSVLGKVTNCNPVVWGDSIVGFGEFMMKCGKRDVRWFYAGAAMRGGGKEIVVYTGRRPSDAMLQLVGISPAAAGSSCCLRFKSLANVTDANLEKVVSSSLMVEIGAKTATREELERMKASNSKDPAVQKRAEAAAAAKKSAKKVTAAPAKKKASGAKPKSTTTTTKSTKAASTKTKKAAPKKKSQSAAPKGKKVNAKKAVKPAKKKSSSK
jgi:hypothetical protein